MAITHITGINPKTNKRKGIAHHNGGMGSYLDVQLKKKYRKLGWKKVTSKQLKHKSSFLKGIKKRNKAFK